MRSFRFLHLFALPALALCLLGEDIQAQEHASHITADVGDVEWGPGPAFLPPGAQATVLEGDPSEAGPFTLRLKMPDGYRIPPHWHSIVENVTVLSGSLFAGMGGEWTDAEMHRLGMGGFVSLPANDPHYVRAEGEAVVQLHGIGPIDIVYVNESDDPRK